MTTTTLATPDYVKESQVFDFDVYNHPMPFADIHLSLKNIYAQAPDIFYTPRNDGHWVVSNYDVITRILHDDEHFSTERQDIPRTEGSYKLIPMNLDPPESTKYRRVLLKYFGGAAISKMEAITRSWAVRLIEPAVDQGYCQFDEIGTRFPVSIFMELMGLDMNNFEYFRSLVAGYFGYLPPEEKLKIQEAICAELDGLLLARTARREDDLASKLIDETIDGKPMTEAELQGIFFTLFIGGLDSVASSINFAMYHLARHPELQQTLVEYPDKISEFVEEAYRRYGIANTTRMVKKDCVVDGAQMRVGDKVLCTIHIAGLQDDKYEDADDIKLGREKQQHLAFSTGSHTCIGHFLARMEMRVFIEEWLKKINSCRVAAGYTPQFRPGLVVQLPKLELEWNAAKSN